MKKLAWTMLVLAPVACWAQSEAGVVPAPGAAAPPGRAAPPRPNPAATREVTLPLLHDRLALTTAQQTLWQVFESKVEAYTETHYRQKPVLPSPEDAAPHQIGRMVDNLQNRLAALEEVEAAAKTLYASLAPGQQKTANQMLLLAIPTFAAVAGGPNQPAEEGRRKGGKPEGGMRSHRGAGPGGMGGGAGL